MFFRLVKQMTEREGVTEQLKMNNQMEWVGCMNNIHCKSMKIITQKFVYIIEQEANH